MVFLTWIFFIALVLGLVLVLMFLFYFLFPAVSDRKLLRKNPVLSDGELNCAIPKSEKYKVSDYRAVVLCSPNKEFKAQQKQFNSMYSCLVASSVFTSGSDCAFACIGLGDCVKACPQKAIEIVNHTAAVTNLCVGCGKCVSACPKGIIRLFPKEEEKVVLCSNSDKTLTTCSTVQKEEKFARKDKKDFKIWYYCYRMLKGIPKK